MKERKSISPTPEIARLKVHLRRLDLAGTTYHVVTLRPSTRARFSTNFYHCTWHVVSDAAGARLLARLLWGLSYQRQPNTLVLLDAPHLVPTPFDGRRSEPAVFLPAGLTPVREEGLRRLKSRLGRLGPPDQTIRWQTFGLDRELAHRDASEEPSELRREIRALHRPGRMELLHERMSHLGGFVCYSAPPAVLRAQALIVHGMRTSAGSRFTEMDYHFLAERTAQGGYWADGEVQIFHDYRDAVAAAAQARREVLARPDAPADPEVLEEVVSGKRREILGGRRRGRAATG